MAALNPFIFKWFHVIGKEHYSIISTVIVNKSDDGSDHEESIQDTSHDADLAMHLASLSNETMIQTVGVYPELPKYGQSYSKENNYRSLG